MEVIKEIPEPEAVDPERTAVKYVGRRPEYSDGMIWNRNMAKKIKRRWFQLLPQLRCFLIQAFILMAKVRELLIVLNNSDNDDEKQEELHNIRNSIYEMTKGIAVRKYIADKF